MHDLKALLAECQKELDALGIRYGKVASIEPYKRVVRSWGTCKRLDGPNTFCIKINPALLEDHVPIDGAKNTVLHELLHTCPGCMTHKGRWKAYAARVNARYGYNIKRCSNPQEKGVDAAECKPREKVKYRFQCQRCGSIAEYRRKSHFTVHYTSYTCAKCGGHFKPV